MWAAKYSCFEFVVESIPKSLDHFPARFIDSLDAHPMVASLVTAPTHARQPINADVIQHRRCWLSKGAADGPKMKKKHPFWATTNQVFYHRRSSFPPCFSTNPNIVTVIAHTGPYPDGQTEISRETLEAHAEHAIFQQAENPPLHVQKARHPRKLSSNDHNGEVA